MIGCRWSWRLRAESCPQRSAVRPKAQSDLRHSQTVRGEKYVVGRHRDQGFSWGPQCPLDDHRLWGVRSGFEEISAA